jgi:hypothetical protein
MSQIKNLFTGVYQHNLWGWGRIDKTKLDNSMYVFEF